MLHFEGLISVKIFPKRFFFNFFVGLSYRNQDYCLDLSDPGVHGHHTANRWCSAKRSIAKCSVGPG